MLCELKGGRDHTKKGGKTGEVAFQGSTRWYFHRKCRGRDSTEERQQIFDDIFRNHIEKSAAAYGIT